MQRSNLFDGRRVPDSIVVEQNATVKQLDDVIRWRCLQVHAALKTMVFEVRLEVHHVALIRRTRSVYCKLEQPLDDFNWRFDPNVSNEQSLVLVWRTMTRTLEQRLKIVPFGPRWVRKEFHAACQSMVASHSWLTVGGSGLRVVVCWLMDGIAACGTT